MEEEEIEPSKIIPIAIGEQKDSSYIGVEV